jgi:hypothetical protein
MALGHRPPSATQWASMTEGFPRAAEKYSGEEQRLCIRKVWVLSLADCEHMGKLHGLVVTDLSDSASSIQ